MPEGICGRGIRDLNGVVQLCCIWCLTVQADVSQQDLLLYDQGW